ncbi:MAG: cobalt-precorrin-5B (C(1))-methyltransferase [Lachnospiraceae bacterium]|nr:cobalt-precorrin-5B (C(1))-methyltransferase [Lachnospiraceae bacterium]
MPGKVLFSEDLGIVAITEVGRKIVGMTAQPGLEGRNKKGQDITENAEQSITSGPVPDLSDYGVVVCSNFIGEALDEVINDGFEEVLLIGHAGKLVKLAGGIMNTHSRMADCRMELICAHAAVQGAGSEHCKRILGASTTEAAFSLIREESEGLLIRVLNALLSAIQFHLNERIRKHEKGMESSLRIGAVMFFKV